MGRPIQVGFLVVGVVAVILTIGFYFQMPWATSLWMWPDGRLTYIFVASITAAIAAPIFWMGLTRDWGAAAGGAVNLIVQAGGMALFLIQLSSSENRPELLAYVLVFAAFALFNVGVFFWGRRFPIHETRPTPRPVYYSFVVFVVLLVIFAVALLLKSPNIFPWPLKPETSVVIGWVFVGTAVYFSYPFVRSGWSNAIGQLLGFLAYDIILIVPFLGHFNEVLPEHRLSLTIYTGVLIYSGALAIYYLFIHKATRIIAPAADASAVQPAIQS
jgi:hypothetical protein